MSLCHIFTIFCVQVGHLVQGPQDEQNQMGSLFVFTLSGENNNFLCMGRDGGARGKLAEVLNIGCII